MFVSLVKSDTQLMTVAWLPTVILYSPFSKCHFPSEPIKAKSFAFIENDTVWLSPGVSSIFFEVPLAADCQGLIDALRSCEY